MNPEEVLSQELDKQPPHIRQMLIRRALRMIFDTEVIPEDEKMFNDWRRSHGLKPLDENNFSYD